MTYGSDPERRGASTPGPGPVLVLAALLLAGSGRLAGQSDSTLLDGPCLEEERDPGRQVELMRAQLDARKRGDHAETIRLQKAFVRQMCHNPWRWIDLAALYLEQDRADLAVQIVDHIDPWAANTLQRDREEPDSRLEGLWESAAFRGSALERRMEERRAVHRRRIRRGRAKLDSLSERPPEAYVAEGVCPYECCVYRRWDVLEGTKLYRSVEGDSVVATVAAGDTVEGLTGEVHLRPVPVTVVHRPANEDRIRPGDLLFLLDDVGEGFTRIWHEGDVFTMQAEVRAYCPVPGPHCWGEHLNRGRGRTDGNYVWWVRVETEDGTVGWTAEPEHFGNRDACG